MGRSKLIITLLMAIFLTGVSGHMLSAEAQTKISGNQKAGIKVQVTPTQKGLDVEASVTGASLFGGRNVLCCEASCVGESRACYAPSSKCKSVCEDFCDCGNGAGVIVDTVLDQVGF